MDKCENYEVSCKIYTDLDNTLRCSEWQFEQENNFYLFFFLLCCPQSLNFILKNWNLILSCLCLNIAGLSTHTHNASI